MMKSADREPKQAEKAARPHHADSNAGDNADQATRPNPADNKPQQDRRSAKGTNESELGPGSELDAVPPDASIPKKP